jgi:phosphomannomutase
VLQALEGAGFDHVHPVPEQQQPDGEFPTVRFPNPEEPGALDLSLALAEQVEADLILANDPDADRLAVVARDASGKLSQLTGDEVGVLLGHYVLTETRPRPANPLVLATIVSSAQLGQIAGEQGARYDETLTGFRWICNRALELESDEKARFLFGYEEALGYSVGTAVRDKDGVGAALVFADLAGWCRSRGITVLEHLEQIQRRHGLFLARQVSFRFPGIEGPATIARVMEGFRERPPSHVGEREVRLTKDYLEGMTRGGGQEQRLTLPSSNVIAFDLGDGDRVTLRPSGTEPKIKYYFELRERPGSGESVEAARARGERRLESLIGSFLELARERGQPD